MDFEKVTPESVGISSADIEKFAEALDSHGLTTHSFMIVKDGKCACEYYYKPFHKNFRHRMYSVSKSFVSAAIGILQGEGKISLSDKVYTFFPEYDPKDLHPYLLDTTIRDLLMMASPFDKASYSKPIKEMLSSKESWISTFFTVEPNHPAGTVFKYDTAGTYILDVIVERVTGMPFMDYLYEKALKHIGFSENVQCIKAPEGYSWGGSGVLCTMSDLASFAYMFMKGGMGYIPADYVKEAISKQIDNYDGHTRNHFYGYGYQFFCSHEGSFSLNGMGNQHAVCYPDKDLMFIINSDNQGYENCDVMIFELFTNYILKKMSPTPLPENKKSYESLENKMANKEILKTPGKAHSPEFEKEYGGKRFVLNNNPMEIKWFELDFSENYGIFRYENARGIKEIPFGYQEHFESQFPETHYSGDTIRKPMGRGYRCFSCGGWVEEHKLNIKTNIIDDYMANMLTTVSFKGNEVTLFMRKNAEWFLLEYQGCAGGKIL